jgi:hypothetical protein
MHGAQRRTIARYSKELQRRHVPPQACYSRCSVIHPVGDHGYRSYFHQNQKPVIRMERSTDFFRLKQGIIELKAAGLSFSLAESVSSNHSLDCYGR